MGQGEFWVLGVEKARKKDGKSSANSCTAKYDTSKMTSFKLCFCILNARSDGTRQAIDWLHARTD